MPKFLVTEYGSSFDIYEVEAESPEQAEQLVSDDKGTLIKSVDEHDFFDIEAFEFVQNMS